jgi:hypothetical protein
VEKCGILCKKMAIFADFALLCGIWGRFAGFRQRRTQAVRRIQGKVSRKKHSS